MTDALSRDPTKHESPGQALQLTKDRGKPKLLFFYAPTSGRSRRVEGFVAQVLQRNHNHDTFDLIRVDAEKRPDLVKRFRITNLPELLVIDEGKVQTRLRQPRGATTLADALAPWLRGRPYSGRTPT